MLRMSPGLSIVGEGCLGNVVDYVFGGSHFAPLTKNMGRSLVYRTRATRVSIVVLLVDEPDSFTRIAHIYRL